MASCLYQEIRFDINPPRSASIDTIFLPTSSASTFRSRDFPKRRRVERRLPYDDVHFASEHLATESSIFYRSTGTSNTRSILWRILEDRHVLELQAADLYHGHSTPEQPVTLRFLFDTPLIPQGVVFADRVGNDPFLIVYNVTSRGELVSLALGDEVFTRTGVLEEGPGAKNWWRVYSPSALKIRFPYRLFASNDSNLWIALNDGSFLRLQRSESSENWNDIIFSDATWTSSMKSLVSWKGHATARYGDVDLGQKAANTICVSPSGLLLWTVTMDHTIRAWSTASGKVELTMDLSADDTRDLKQPSAELLDPNSSNLLRVVRLRGHGDKKYVLLAYSPSHRVFKFWTVEEQHNEFVTVTVMVLFEHFHFKPPIDDLIDSIGWQVIDFQVINPRNMQDSTWDFWILIRSGSRCHTFMVSFNPEERPQRLSQAWRDNWAEVYPGFRCLSSLQADLEHPSNREQMPHESGPIENWMTWLLTPGRFASDLLEAALSVYKRGIPGRRGRNKLADLIDSSSFRQRLSATIASAVPDSAFGTEASFLNHGQQISKQLSTFDSVLEDLQKQRERTLSLAIDVNTGTPWLVMADQVSVVRNCSDLELIYHNEQQYTNHLQSFNADNILLKALSDSMSSNVGILTNAIRDFRNNFSKEFLLTFKTELVGDLTRKPRRNLTLESRMQTLYDALDFGSAFDDTGLQRLTEYMNKLGGFGSLETSLFTTFFELFEEKPLGKPQKKVITSFGARALISGARDILRLETEILMDVLLFSVFMGCDIEPSEISDAFSPADIFGAASERFKERLIYQLLISAYPMPDNTSEYHQLRRHATILESVQLHDWACMNTPKTNEMGLLKYWIRAWTFQKDLRQNYNEAVPEIMSWLLINTEVRLARQFLKFMPTTPWAEYVSARYHLASNEWLDAAILLTSIADDVSADFDVVQYDSGGLIAPNEKILFCQGLASYYLHVMNLFQSHTSPAFANDFARLALQAVNDDDEEDETKFALKSQIHHRLFITSIQTSRFEDAFAALSKQTDLTLRSQLLSNFLQAILSSTNVDLLFELPWSSELAVEADARLFELSTSTHSLPSSSNTFEDELIPTNDRVPPHRLLYAWRIKRNDFRGAASALWEQVQMLKLAQTYGLRGDDIDSELQHTYLNLINCMVLVNHKLRWLLVRPLELEPSATRTPFTKTGTTITDRSEQSKWGARRIITVDHMRREYQEHLDRTANLAAGRVPLELSFPIHNATVGSRETLMQAGTNSVVFGGSDLSLGSK